MMAAPIKMANSIIVITVRMRQPAIFFRSKTPAIINTSSAINSSKFSILVISFVGMSDKSLPKS